MPTPPLARAPRRPARDKDRLERLLWLVPGGLAFVWPMTFVALLVVVGSIVLLLLVLLGGVL
ncbi:MAG: hypothetical protein M9894_27195 [Planctomycetes bacterium]|nr:hypothetical protein [Planctomycetota bacterium]